MSQTCRFRTHAPQQMELLLDHRVGEQSRVVIGERWEALKPAGRPDRASLDSSHNWDKVALPAQNN
jgi:hypothetical protein